MSMTAVEKILSSHAGEEVRAGSFVEARVDLVLANDITGPLAIEIFREMGAGRVFDPDKVVLVPDHFVPNKDVRSAEQARILRQFAREQKITHYFELGEMGIEHVLLPEKGLVMPGQVIVGADSHTCTYGALGAFATGVGSTDVAAAMALGRLWFRVPETLRLEFRGTPSPAAGAKDLILHAIGEIGVDGARYMALEFSGPAMEKLSVEGRLTMANMAVEAGAKVGLFAVDAKTREYLGQDVRGVETDPDASFTTRVLDVDGLPPLVAAPHLPSNVRPAEELRHVRVDQVYIGSCTNGRLEDLEAAASILKGHRVAPGVRVLVVPGSQAVYLAALRRGIIETFVEAGAAVSTPTCGACLGGHMGVLAGGERCLATTNRNFVGRMGHKSSEVYLAGPAVAAATALTGYITDPREVVSYAAG